MRSVDVIVFEVNAVIGERAQHAVLKEWAESIIEKCAVEVCTKLVRGDDDYNTEIDRYSIRKLKQLL